MIAQGLWQAHYQILPIVSLKEFIELNVSSDMTIKDVKHVEYTNFKDDLIECKCLCCNKIYQHKFDEKLKEQFF